MRVRVPPALLCLHDRNWLTDQTLNLGIGVRVPVGVLGAAMDFVKVAPLPMPP
jgi:hypothetical protein